MNKKAALDLRYKMRHSEKVIIDDAFAAKHFDALREFVRRWRNDRQDDTNNQRLSALVTFDVKGNGHCFFPTLVIDIYLFSPITPSQL